MFRPVLCLLVACASVLSTAQFSIAQTKEPSAPETISTRTANLKRQDGFLPYHWDAKKGMLLFELSPAAREREFLYFTGLGSGVGSVKLFADRSTIGHQALCRFRQVGMRVLVIEENPFFRAENGSSDLKKSVEVSFPTSVVAALPVEAESEGTLLVNANSLLLRDATGLLSQMRRPTQAINGQMVRQESKDSNWRLDDARSVVDLDASGSFFAIPRSKRC